MSELAYLAPSAADPVSADLSARAGRIAWRVADVVEEHCTPESGSLDAVAFLRGWSQAADAAASGPPLLTTPLQRVARVFDLTQDETDLVLLAGLPDEHEGLAATFRSLHPAGEPRPTAGLAALLHGGSPADRARVRALLSSGAAVEHGLIRLEGTGPFFERSLMLAEELWPVLHGCDAWPAGLPRATIVGAPAGMSAWLDLPDVRACVDALRRNVSVVIVVPHEDAHVGAVRCEAIAAAAGRDIVGAMVATDDGRDIRLLLAHAVARGAIPMIVASHLGERAASIAIGDYPGTVVVTAPPGTLLAPAGKALLHVDAGPVPIAAVRDAWAAALPGLASEVTALAARHPLDPAITAELALDLAIAGQDPAPGDVSKIVRRRAGVNLPPGTHLVVPDVSWSQMVLPADAFDQLHAAVARLEQQARVLEDWRMSEHSQATRGVRMLFTGPPGTGKSLAASALATEIGTDLMVVDVARLVSKWLGETEKNLSATFEAAERTRAVLLLDEADALFGTRTEISDAHDRYANLETAYLLQRVEQFEGLVVLTSNMRQNIDPAFTRRLDFVVEFPLPDAAARVALWKRSLPPELGDVRGPNLDLDGLARIYPIPGGWIRNAAVAAAFTAAASGKPITQRRLVDAVRREYLKASTPFPGEPPRRRDDQD